MVVIQLKLDDITEQANREKVFWDKKEWAPTNTVYYKFVFDEDIGSKIIEDLVGRFSTAQDYGVVEKGQKLARYNYTEFGYRRFPTEGNLGLLRTVEDLILGSREFNTLNKFAIAYLVNNLSDESARLGKEGVIERPQKGQHILVIQNPNTALKHLQSHFLDLMNAFYDAYKSYIQPRTPSETLQAHLPYQNP